MTDIAPLIDSPALNKKLLKNARQPINVIAERTGLPAGEVAERLMLLLDATNWRDDLLEEKLLLYELQVLTEDIRARMKTASTDEDYGSMARAQLASIKLMLDQLDKRRKLIDGDLATLTQAEAKIVASAFEVAMEMTVQRLLTEHPGWDAEVIRTTMTEVLPFAVAAVEKHVND